MSVPTPDHIGLSIGVTGHRGPPKLPKESEAPLRATINRILSAVIAMAPNSQTNQISYSPREFIIMSSLAEGSDRIVAEAGLAAGFRLEVILPLRRAEYACDFEIPKSRLAFERLLDRASAIFELNGTADDRSRAYLAAGFAMLEKIDILITIWDGKEASGIGGTEQIVNKALAKGIIVVWVEPTKPDALKISVISAEDNQVANARSVTDKFKFFPADESTVASEIKKVIQRRNITLGHESSKRKSK
jgi:hypothetical protein